MAWTASVIDKDSEWVYIEFQKDGVRAFADKYRIPLDGASGIPRIVRQEIARLTAKEAAPIAVGPVAPAPDPTPDPDQSLKDQFIANVELLAQLEKAVAIGLVAANDPQLINLKTNMQTQFNSLTPAQKRKVIEIL